jgi:signal transduction histidine kinase
MRRSAEAGFAITVVALITAIAWLIFHPMDALSSGDVVFDILLILAGVTLAGLGRAIVRKVGNRMGLVLLGLGVSGALIGVLDIPIKTVPPPYPGWLSFVGVLAVAADTLTVACLSIVPLLFPTGSIPSPKWRWAWWLWIVGVSGFAFGTMTGQFDLNAPGLSNPLHSSALDPIGHTLQPYGGSALLIVVVAGFVSLVIRGRQGNSETRAQVRWLAFVGGLALAGFVLAGVGEAIWSQDSLLAGLGWGLFVLSLMFGIPGAIAIAVFKYRLYGIDIVIKKTVVFGLLAVFITGVYAAIVAAASLAFEGSQTGSVLAAAVLAMLFAPARARAQRIADRLVYGDRATPYEVLADFSARVGSAYADEDVLSRMASVLMEGTGASGARVLLQVGNEQREAASVGQGRRDGGVADEDVVSVTHQGEHLGALAVTMPASDPMNPAKHQLVEDLASQAGLVLRNVKLIEELKASRQRLVAAQDDERRRIERNLHDGVQQQLVALNIQLGLLPKLAEKDPAKVAEIAAGLQGQASEALDDLRDLARGIYPPLLADKGLAAALLAQARKAAVATTVSSDGIGRYDQAAEAAVYFCVLEGLNNVAKYANASGATIALQATDGELSFTITDDGIGFDTSKTNYGTGLQGMADRLDAIGGRLNVTSEPGAGTTVTGTIPIGGER